MFRYSLENCLSECSNLKTRLELISYLQAQASTEERLAVVKWCDEQAARSWTALTSPLKEDVPVFLTAFREQGPSFFSDI